MSDYTELAERAEAGALHPKKGTVRRGANAAAAAQQALIEAAGTDDLESAVRVARGRPRLDATAPSSHVWKVRPTPFLDEQVRLVALERGVTISQVVRDAVAAYVQSPQTTTPSGRS